MELPFREDKVYVFREGLELFHVTPIKTDDPYQTEYSPWMKDVPIGGHIYNLDSDMSFGLSEEFTLYFDSTTEGEWQGAHLATTTTSVLKLIDYGTYKPMWDEKENRRLRDLGIDGWIVYPDPRDYYREITLFNPRGKIAPFRELGHTAACSISDTTYKWRRIDQLNINKSCIGFYSIEDLIVN